MRSRLAVGVVCTAALTSLLGSAGRAAAATAPNLNYDVDLSLLDVDQLAHPGSPSGNEPPAALGLRRLRIGLNWEVRQGAGLSVVLRPDALSRNGGNAAAPARDVDTRSGDPLMAPLPTVRLLDAYQIHEDVSPSFGASAGVYETLAEDIGAFPEVLGFGLGVLMPAKFSGVRVTYRHESTAQPSPQALALQASPAPFMIDLYWLQGNEDRAEALSTTSTSTSFDQVPVAQDPYTGGAAVIRWAPAKALGLRLVSAYTVAAGHDSGAILATATAASPPLTTLLATRHDQVLLALSADQSGRAFNRAYRLTADLRYAKERWQGSVAAHEQESAMLTGAAEVGRDIWALVGIGYGKDERWQDRTLSNTVPLTGYQLEAGVLAVNETNLQLELMLSHEWRVTRDNAGGTSPGFYSDPTDPFNRQALGAHSSLNRFGLQIRYLLDKNA